MKRKRQITIDLDDVDIDSIEIEEEIVDTLVLIVLRAIRYNINFLVKNEYNYEKSIVSYALKQVDIIFDINALSSKEYQNELLFQVSKVLKKIESNRYELTYPKVLENNVKTLAKGIGLTKTEEEFLKFAISINYYESLNQIVGLFGDNLNSNKILMILSVVTKESVEKLKIALSRDSKLSTSGLLTIDDGFQSLKGKIDLISFVFAEQMMSENKNIYDVIVGMVSATSVGSLSIKDYGYMDEKLKIIMTLLEKQVHKISGGINILIYGDPGTGKTELVKAIAKKLNVDLYEINYQNSTKGALRGAERLKAFSLAQSVFDKNKNILLLFDEVEDVFDDADSRATQSNKAYVNRMLENSTVPTIWLSNSVLNFDNAFLRRFDIVFELPIPPKQKRYNIIAKEADGILDKDTIMELSESEILSPAVVSKTMNTIRRIKDELDKPSKYAKLIIQSMLEAQGYMDAIGNSKTNSLPSFYDPIFVNASMNLKALAEGIGETKSARVCLYGPPGTGKSAFGKWLSQSLDKPFVLKKGSDLLGAYVGETEKNIKKAFEEAKNEGAVLIFDEVDSFLFDRKMANQRWEITQVNEMLVQMESFDGIFLATTNLIDSLDEASLRRFDAKIEFGFLKKDQATNLFKKCIRELGLMETDSLVDDISMIPCLTPGDFDTVMRQNKFNKIKTANDFMSRIKSEVAIKKVALTSRVGFLA